MNRQQKREFKQNAKKHGFTSEEADYLLEHKPNPDKLWEGAKVKLDTVWMRISPDWEKNKLRKEYKDWVLAHKDDVFTVVFDPKRKEQRKENYIRTKNDPNFDIMVCLEEDTTEPKWYFFAGDLILQKVVHPSLKILVYLNIKIIIFQNKL